MTKRKRGTTAPTKGMSRRRFLGTAAATTAAATTVAGFPAIVRGQETLRTVGLAVSIINEIQSQAAEDLGFPIRGQALGYGAMLTKMLNQTDQFECAEAYYNDMDLFIPAKVFQPDRHHPGQGMGQGLRPLQDRQAHRRLQGRPGRRPGAADLGR